MFLIDNQSRLAVYEQIVSQVERFILTGVFKADDALPSVRSLSLDLAVNPNTIQKAYTDIERRGITYTVKGKGSFVAAQARDIIAAERMSELEVIKNASRELSLAGIDISLAYSAVDNGYGKKGDEDL